MRGGAVALPRAPRGNEPQNVGCAALWTCEVPHCACAHISRTNGCTCSVVEVARARGSYVCALNRFISVRKCISSTLHQHPIHCGPTVLRDCTTLLLQKCEKCASPAQGPRCAGQRDATRLSRAPGCLARPPPVRGHTAVLSASATAQRWSTSGQWPAIQRGESENLDPGKVRALEAV